MSWSVPCRRASWVPGSPGRPSVPGASATPARSARRDWRSDLVNVVAAAVVALLVWAYANDRTRETATLAGTVRLAVADPRAQYVEPSAAITVSVELRGSRRSIERAERALRAGVALAPGTDGLPGEPG
ncbi:MAG: hypothetical protein ACKOFI_12150, partial [Phycisphaerales bacterium]